MKNKIKFLLLIILLLSGNLILQSQSKLAKTAHELENRFYVNADLLHNNFNRSRLTSNRFFIKERLKVFSNTGKEVNGKLFENISNANLFSQLFKQNYSSSTVVDSVIGIDFFGKKFKKIYGYDNKGNLISDVTQTLDGNKWINSLRTTYAFDQNRMRTLFLHENWSGNQWVGVDKVTFTYDSNGNRIEELSGNWNGAAWVNNNRYTTSYNSKGEPISKLKENWDLTQSQWLNVNRDLYSYESDGTIITTQEKWDGSQWIKDNRSTAGFDSNGRLLAHFEETWDGSNWVKVERTSFTYDSNSRLNLFLGEEWNGTNWQNSWRYTYVFASNGSITSRLFENWNNSTSLWEGDSRITYKYDSNGNNTERLNEDWDGSQWVNTTRVTYSYNSGNNMTFALAEKWESSTWIESPTFLGFNTGSFSNNNYQSFFFFASQITVYYNSLTAVESDNNLPTQFELSQNYPNPFNPSTTIEYSIPVESVVELKVYDLLGSEVASLVNEKQSAGSYKTNFDASRLSSGIYLVKLSAGKYVQTKKMILMK